jgi:phage terminase large subunit-like protein
MAWRDPEYEGEFPSLGWEILGWFRDYLPSPADEAKPLILTDEQATILIRWYGLDAETGVFVYRRGILEMAKGWGKSPFVGAIALAELAGPVRFAGWDARGDPVGAPWGTLRTDDDHPPWVQIAAVSEDQTDNTYSALYELLTANDHKAAKELKIDDGRTRLFLRDRPGRLEPVTASAGSREGQRVTFAVLDETHLWLETNHGVKLSGTLRRNAGKMNGRTLETTNAPALGQRSVAERSSVDVLSEPGILRYAKQPAKQPEQDWDDARMLDALGAAYGDAWWIDLGRLLKEIRDPATAWDDSLRFYFNIPVAAAEHWIKSGAWNDRARKKRIPKGAEVVLGFSGTQNSTAAGLIGCTPEGHVFVVGAWESKQVAHGEVEGAVVKAMRRYQVTRLVCNPTGWEKDCEDWAETYGQDVVVQFSLRQHVKFIAACDKFYTAVAEGSLTHDGDPRLTRHLANARPRDTGEGVRIIDGPEGYPATLAKAAVIAFEQATQPAKEPLVAWL